MHCTLDKMLQFKIVSRVHIDPKGKRTPFELDQGRFDI
jgi:hypothetical protein